MQQQPSTTANSAPGLTSLALEIIPTADWSVVELEVLPSYRLKVKFKDGLSGFVDMSPLLHSDQAGVFARLRDAALFAQASICYGAVAWPGIDTAQPALDLAPDAMHRAIAQNGEWVLTG